MQRAKNVQVVRILQKLVFYNTNKKKDKYAHLCCQSNKEWLAKIKFDDSITDHDNFCSVIIKTTTSERLFFYVLYFLPRYQ